jgi:hypothetical protein
MAPTVVTRQYNVRADLLQADEQGRSRLWNFRCRAKENLPKAQGSASSAEVLGKREKKGRMNEKEF